MILDSHIRPAELNDLDQVQNLLTKVDLPLNGVKDQFSNFFILENENSIIGSIGLEIYSSYALLRSLAVDPDFQNLKLGSKLLLKIETYANSKKINHIYLLTETAE